MNRVLENRYYYLDNFEMVLRWVEQRYSDLLLDTERDFIGNFSMLPRASRALLVRMIMRKGTLFRSSKLHYDEIGGAVEAAQALIEQRWLDDRPPLTLEQLFTLLTKAELGCVFDSALPDKNARKADQLQSLKDRYTELQPYDAWYCGATDHVYELLVMPVCECLRLMFFGNLRQDWSEFVLADLGLYAYEKVEFPATSRIFQNRQDIADYLHLHHCRERLRSGTDAGLVQTDIPSDPYQNEWLEQRRAKLLFQIARHYEKDKDWARAHALYSQCAYSGARSRAVRVLERSEQFEPALQLALAAQQQPESEAEQQQMGRIVPRLLCKLGHPPVPRASAVPIAKLTLTLPEPSLSMAVEELVQSHFQQALSPVYYVENTLANALFGLLCWRAIFAPLPGAFFHPYQSAPADLHSADFYRRRQELFRSCLAQLDSGEYTQTIAQNFRNKAGIRSDFVAWEILSHEILDQALACIPALHLKKWFERILLDIPSNRSGFPDLIQFWPREKRYRMIEVKGPGDRLQDNQLRWFDYCAKHDMPVAVCYVRWAEDAA
ncbi:VRR-NUC domain-containing protein [Paralcaligenes sp. KSB-10]|uniref:VRR-NUC domain-containing protein n=1 Tax=Paralcaligenes sp. KSB-10 TaxID=2901142 RepID=UPI001E37DEA2|nr:VRR-NUC domain-containing protein [Paralcaligenes sp. KSB-10]UHL64706.1 VRR-NUC domain-containing protein [Paralcaligenes sp. KSB-10]